MDPKIQAKMLFNMHLGIKDMFQPGKSPGLEYYGSKQFLDGLQHLDPLEMDEGDRIAYSFPNYEILVHFTNGDLVLFLTEGGFFHVSRLCGHDESTQLLIEIARKEPGLTWDDLSRIIHVPFSHGVWGAPL